MPKSKFASIARRVLLALAITALPSLAVGLPFPDIYVRMSDLDSEPLRTGQPYSTLELDRIVPGMPSHEVEALMGQPDRRGHYDDMVHWDYNVNFPIAGQSSQLVCQYKVVVGPEGMVISTHWRRHVCESLHQSLMVGSPKDAAQVMTLSADILFAFGEATLTAEGEAKLREVAEALMSTYENPVITLVGHADRIGSRDYNLELSQRRAEAVRRSLARYGLPSASMVAEGRGDTEPVVACRTDDLGELKRCLQPNRRVSIEVFERRSDTNSI